MLLCLLALVVLSQLVSPRDLLTDEWASKNLGFRAAHMVAALHLKIISCYVGFSSMEANFIACGQSYKPAHEITDKDGKVIERVPEDFFYIKQIKIWVFETMETWTGAVTGWNIQVHNWLKYYIMLRMMDRSKPRGQLQVMPMIMTFVVSAAWHGIMLGFFACFIGIAFVDYQFKVGEKTRIGNWVLTNVPYRVYHPFLWAYSMYLGCYCVLSFVLTSFEEFNFVYSHLYYSGHLCIFGGSIIVTILPKVSRRSTPAPSATAAAVSAATGGTSTTNSSKKDN